MSNRALDADTAYKLTANGCAENAQAFAAGDVGPLDMIMLDYPGCNPMYPRLQPYVSQAATLCGHLELEAQGVALALRDEGPMARGAHLGYMGLQPGRHGVAAWETWGCSLG